MNRIIIVLLLLTSVMTSCGQKSGGSTSEEKEEVEVPKISEKEDYLITINTPQGKMFAILFDDTPKHKENFLKLAYNGYYDNTLFHRVIKEFMIQGGDPNSKTATASTRLGDGGPGYTIEAEFKPHHFHEKGAIAAARQGDQVNPAKASSGSQFYIVQGKVHTEEELKYDMQKLGMAYRTMVQNRKPEHQAFFNKMDSLGQARDQNGQTKWIIENIELLKTETGIDPSSNLAPERLDAYTTRGGTPFLDDSYTVFGKVIKGIEVVDKITDQEKGQGDRPVVDIPMKIKVEVMKRKKIEKEYGYKYPE